MAAKHPKLFSNKHGRKVPQPTTPRNVPPAPAAQQAQPVQPARPLPANKVPGQPTGPLDLDSAINPYNFVPLSSYIFEPDWAAQVSHDHPFEDGWTGHIAYTVEAVTPLLIGGEAQATDGTRSPDRYPIQIDGEYTIPSTSMLGMVRNVVEIASFGRLARGVEERSLAMRNVDDAQYRLEVPAASVEAGWLYRTTTGWEIAQCEFARLDRNDAALPLGKNASFNATTCFFDYTGASTVAGKGIFQSPGSGRQGNAVRTGFIQPRIGQKREYVFFMPTGAPVQVDQNAYASFDAAHSTNAVWRNQRDGSPGGYQRKLLNGEKIPVFYVPAVAAKGCFPARQMRLGLAAMFRVMMPISLHMAIHQPSPALANSRPDLASILFGQHDSADGPLRGRVSFSHAFAEGHPSFLNDGRGGPWIRAILSSPKPTFNPAYIQQTAEAPQFKSLMDPGSALSGWKRYPVGGSPSERARLAFPINAQGKENPAVQSNLYPLPAGTVFEGLVHVHNLRLLELGALLWALGWGRSEFPELPGSPNYLHSLGLGKPLGLGQVRVTFSVDSAALKANNGAAAADIASRAITTFVDSMNDSVPGTGQSWRYSEQIKELLALADPETVKGRVANIGYLDLKQHRALRPVGGNPRRPLARHSKDPTNGGTWKAV